MGYPTLRHPVFTYAAPGLLVLIACLQLWRAHTQNLTPWKGGGFGMFSTVDDPGKRILRTYLITPEGEALALYGTLSVQTLRVKSMPDTETLEQVARDAAADTWVIYPFEEVLDEIASMPEGLKDYLARTPAMERRRRISRRERLLARTDSLEASPDSALIAIDTSAVESYPALIAFAQPRPRPPGVAEPDIEHVRVEVWAMRYDQEGHRAAPELLHQVTRDFSDLD